MTSNDFAWGLGGGIDLNIVKFVAVRPAQIDYIQIRTGDDVTGNVNSFGYSAGLVIKF